MNQHSINIFLEFDIDCIETMIQSGQIQVFSQMIDLLSKTQEVNVLVSQENLKDFMNEEMIELLTDNIEPVVTNILRFEPWEVKRISGKQENIKYYHWQFGNIEEAKPLLAEIAEHQIIHENFCLLIQCCKKEKHSIYIIRNNQT